MSWNGFEQLLIVVGIVMFIVQVMGQYEDKVSGYRARPEGGRMRYWNGFKQFLMAVGILMFMGQCADKVADWRSRPTQAQVECILEEVLEHRELYGAGYIEMGVVHAKCGYSSED